MLAIQHGKVFYILFPLFTFFLYLCHRINIFCVSMYRNLYIVFLFSLFVLGKGHAQNKPLAEVFCGAELNYADVNFSRLYNVLINLTPGAKIHFGDEWEFDAQVFVPIVNDGYEKRMNMLRLNMASLSKVLRFDDAHQYFKISAGLFGKERYGGDLRWMFPINSWLMVNARLGLTNRWALGMDMYGTSESVFDTDSWTFTGMAGASFWLDKWATEFRAVGGRYLNNDYGVEGEVVRHFKHCSVTVFAQLHELTPNLYRSGRHRYSGGFRVVMMIPPYKKYKRTVVFRPASNFRLTYNAQADGYSMRKYTTDPEENERTYPIRIPWGTGNFDE